MSDQSQSNGLDADVVKIFERFVNLDSDESPDDCLENGGDVLQFTEDKHINITNRTLVAEKGNIVITEGGAGIIIQCSDEEYNREYALKIPRPSMFVDEEKSLQEMKTELEGNRTEAMKQGQLSHNNVAYLVWAEKTSMPGEFRPEGTVMIQEWIEGATPLDEYVHSDETEELETLVRLLRDVFRGLSHIHEKDLIHWDVKGENCLVDDSTGTVKITDVGNAREKRGPGTYEEKATRFTSKKCWPEDTGDYIEEYEGSNRVRLNLGAGDERIDRPWLDLYMAGRMVARICGIEHEVGLNGPEKDTEDKEISLTPSIFDADDAHTDMVRDFLIIIAQRLMKPFESGVDGEYPAYYDSAAEVEQDLQKLLHEFGDAKDIPELYPIPQHVVRMPVTGNTVFSNRVDALVNLEPGMRLTGHEQLGLTRFVYPGGRHSRFEHSLGVVAATLQYIRALYADRTNPTFRLLCDSKHIRALIFASIVHDMGHGAFSHYLEEIQSLFAGCSHEDYLQAVLRGDIDFYDGYSTDDYLKDDCHVRIDRSMLKERVEEDWIKTDPPYDEDPESFMELVADILRPQRSESDDGPETDRHDAFDPDFTDRGDTKKARIWILHSIIDSVLDADKMDYLRRDAEHTGVDYPDGADIDRFLQSLTVASHPPTISPSEFRPTIAVNQKGVNSLESLLLARYQVFKSLYWHRIARSATTLLKNVVMKYIMEIEGESDPYDRRRMELLHTFRELNDEAALEWLLGQSEDAEIDISNYRRSLTRREDLPKPIFDISQGELQPTFERNSEYYDDCERIMEINDRLQELHPDNFYDAWQDLRTHVATATQNRINNFNDDQESTLPTFQLDGENIFIDVPLQGKDQIENLYVVDRRSRLRTDWIKQLPLSSQRFHETESGQIEISENIVGAKYDIRSFHKYSPIADEVQQGFKHWARRIRVFTWQDDQERIRVALNNDDERIAKIVFRSLLDGFEEVENHYLGD